jgi:hypothetical protein
MTVLWFEGRDSENNGNSKCKATANANANANAGVLRCAQNDKLCTASGQFFVVDLLRLIVGVDLWG